MTEKRTKHESASSRSVRAARYPLPIRARVSSPFGAGLVIAGRQSPHLIYLLEHAGQRTAELFVGNKFDVLLFPVLRRAEAHTSLSDSALTR